MSTALLGDILFTLQDIAYMIFQAKIPDFGYLFISNTIIIIIFEFKTTFKIKRLERKLKNLIGDLKDKV